MLEFYRGRMTDAGRVVVPANLRRECQFIDGQEVVFLRSKGGVEILTLPEAVRRAQEAIIACIPGDDLDLTQELLDARRKDTSLLDHETVSNRV